MHIRCNSASPFREVIREKADSRYWNTCCRLMRWSHRNWESSSESPAACIQASAPLFPAASTRAGCSSTRKRNSWSAWRQTSIRKSSAAAAVFRQAQNNHQSWWTPGEFRWKPSRQCICTCRQSRSGLGQFVIDATLPPFSSQWKTYPKRLYAVSFRNGRIIGSRFEPTSFADGTSESSSCVMSLRGYSFTFAR